MSIALSPSTAEARFNELPVFFEGNSRILKQTTNPSVLLCKLKPTVFSLQDNGPVEVAGIDCLRTLLNEVLCDVLHRNGVKTSTITTEGDVIVMEKHEVPPIEVVVKSALVGSPKHIYKNILQTKSRKGEILDRKHVPYVRFDWRNPLPLEDLCMPTGLADHFIDTQVASRTALRAFHVLHECLRQCDLDLLDICFFMNTAGDVICAEISTDNTRINYVGRDPALQKVFSSKDKNTSLNRAEAVLALLKTINTSRSYHV